MLLYSPEWSIALYLPHENAIPGAIAASSLSGVGLLFPVTLQSLLPLPMFLLVQNLSADERTSTSDLIATT